MTAEMPSSQDYRTRLRRYRRDLVAKLWEYRSKYFAQDDKFDHRISDVDRPPVFVPSAAHFNVLVHPSTSASARTDVWAQLPPEKRHRWIRSTLSSQALTVSVFGNLNVCDRLGLLASVTTDAGQPLVANSEIEGHMLTLDYTVRHLCEPRPTSVDVFLSGISRTAIECKLAEPEVGTCSRPNLRPGAPKYDEEYCNGTYSKQRGRTKRCSLATLGVAYWDHVPKLFKWSADTDLSPCPLLDTYQLVRNVLAACVLPNGNIEAETGITAKP